MLFGSMLNSTGVLCYIYSVFPGLGHNICQYMSDSLMAVFLNIGHDLSIHV